jgi:hypothetical protein
VDLSVAVDAGLIREMQESMTFRAQHLDISPGQKEPIGRPMGHVADAAPLHLLGQVLINPGSFLLRMTFEARFILGAGARSPEACPLAGPVGSVAIRALHSTLEYLVRVGQVERRLHILVAREAEVDLFCLQEFPAHGRAMDLMAVIAANGAQLMN